MRLVWLVTVVGFRGVLGSPMPQLVFQTSNSSQESMLQKFASDISPPRRPFLFTGPINISPESKESLSLPPAEHSSLMKRGGDKKKTYNYCSKLRQVMTCITLSNATPYRWRKGYHHSYQTSNWHKWPEYIEPGDTISLSPQYQGNGIFPYRRDTAGEVAYHVEGTENPVSFMLEYRKGVNHNTWIRFMEDLETTNLPKETEIDLGSHPYPDGERFILAGKEGDFVTNNGPEAWMQSMMNEIGDMPLSEIVLGRSHHGGSYINILKGPFATQGNTQAQTEDLYKQLRDGGVRVIDIRTMLWYHEKGDKWEYYECHGTLAPSGFIGALGATYDQMIEAINRFNDDFPGELIILDIAEGQGWEINKELSIRGRQLLFQKLQDGLKHRVELPDSDNYTKLPLKDFIGGGKSGVVIRVGESWVAKSLGKFPGHKEGFVTTKNFPIKQIWSNTNKRKDLMESQFNALRKSRGAPTAVERKPRRLYDLQWVLTLVGADVAHINLRIVPISRKKLWTTAFTDLWATMTVDQFPSWLTVDAIEGTEFKALIMAMNKCFVARGCGDWANKARPVEIRN